MSKSGKNQQPRELIAQRDLAGTTVDPELPLNFKQRRMMADINSLVTFQNRNSCAKTEASGIFRASVWLKNRYLSIPRLRVITDEFPMQRCGFASSGLKQRNIIAVLPVTDANLANQIIVVSGHYDSRTLAVDDSKSDAPGANDSGSQTSVLLEVATSWH